MGVCSRRGKKVPAVLLAGAMGALVGAVGSSAQAAPFVTVRMETDTGQSSATVTPGQVVNYRITVQLNAPVVHNTSIDMPFDLTSIDAATDGVNAARFSMYQLAADGVQANFTAVPALASGWADGLGATGGTLVARGSTGRNDIADLTAAGGLSAFGGRGTGTNGSGVGVPQEMTIATGSFVVTNVSASGVQGSLNLTAQDSGTAGANSSFGASDPGSFRYHTTLADGSSFQAFNAAFSSDSDPKYAFVGLSLTGQYSKGDMNGDGLVNAQDINPFVNRLVTGGLSVTQAKSLVAQALAAPVPEPASAAVLAVSGVALMAGRRRKR